MSEFFRYCAARDPGSVCHFAFGHKGPRAFECAQPFDPSKVERFYPDPDGTMLHEPDGEYVGSADFDTLNLRYTNLQHFMRRMAELHGFEMEETK